MATDADREWARNLAISLGVESFSDEDADIILAALAKRDAERQVELSADDVTRAWRHSGACVPDEPSFIAGLNALLREKRSGK